MLQDQILFLTPADIDISNYLYAVSSENFNNRSSTILSPCFSGIMPKDFTVSTCRPRYISTDLLVNRTYELIRALLIGILFKKERWAHLEVRRERARERKREKDRKTGGRETEIKGGGEDEDNGEKEREKERPVVHDRDTLISRGCPEGRREASSNS